MILNETEWGLRECLVSPIRHGGRKIHAYTVCESVSPTSMFTGMERRWQRRVRILCLSIVSHLREGHFERQIDRRAAGLAILDSPKCLIAVY